MKTIVLVISASTDDRIEEFGKCFNSLKDAECLLAYAEGTQWVRLSSEGKLCPPLFGQNRPTQAVATLVHASDWDKSTASVKQQLAGGLGKVFVFNGPGDPLEKPDAVRILRATQPFGLTSRDAEQLLEFAQNPSRPLPSCCAQPSSILIALDILCQAWLATHGELEHEGKKVPVSPAIRVRAAMTEKTEWWLKELGLENTDTLQKALANEGVDTITSQAIVLKIANNPALSQVLELRNLALRLAK